MEIYQLKDEAYDVPTDGFDWLVYEYESDYYEGSGKAVAYKDGEIYVKELGHCSCYGPFDVAGRDDYYSGSPWDKFSIDDFFKARESIHDIDITDVVMEKVKELLLKCKKSL